MKNAIEPDFQTWYGAAYPVVVRTLTAMVGSVDKAEEFAGEAFLAAFERWPTGDLENPTRWVISVAFNRARRSYRYRVRRVRYLVDIDDHIDTSVVALLETVRGLPKRQSEAVYLRYFADLRESDVALLMGISEGAASSLLVKARHTLRQRYYNAESD